MTYAGSVAVVYLLASVQALFLASLLLKKSEKSAADKVLALWLLAIAFHTLVYFLHFRFQASIPLILNLNAAFPYLQGPFLLAYVATLVGKRDRFITVDLLHLFPAAGFFLFVLLTHGAGTLSVTNVGHSRQVSIFEMSGIFTLLLLASVPAYIVWSLDLMRRARQALDTNIMPARFRWIWFFIIGLGLIWLLSMMSFLSTRDGGHASSPHLIFWALTLFVYGLGYTGLTRTSVFTRPELEVLKQQLHPKYRKSGLKADQAKAAHNRLLEYVDQKQIYLDGDCSLKSLAHEMGYSTNHVSQVINEFEQCNFHDFINSRRVREACKRLDTSPQLNLLELALEVGFNSKSSFNRAFLKHKGKTPTQYLKSI